MPVQRRGQATASHGRAPHVADLALSRRQTDVVRDARRLQPSSAAGGGPARAVDPVSAVMVRLGGNHSPAFHVPLGGRTTPKRSSSSLDLVAFLDGTSSYLGLEIYPHANGR